MSRHLAHNESIHSIGSFIDVGQLKAFAAASLPDLTWAYVDDIGEYYFDKTSNTTESIPDILIPNAGGTGRWRKKAATTTSIYNVSKMLGAAGNKINLSG